MYRQIKRKNKKDTHYSQQHSFKESFNHIDIDVTMFRQKRNKQAHSLISPRTSTTHINSQKGNDRLKRKIDRLNNNCFNQSNLFHYINKPISNVNSPALKFSDVQKSLQLYSPTKIVNIQFRPSTYNFDLNDKRSQLKTKPKKERELSNSKNRNLFLYSTNNDKINDIAKKISDNEIKRRQDNESLNAYRNFGNENNKNYSLRKKKM